MPLKESDVPFGRRLPPVSDNITTHQLSNLQTQIDFLKSQQDALALQQQLLTPSDTAAVVPALVNILNNTDNIYSEEIYNATAFVDDEDTLASIYQKAQSSGIAWESNVHAAEATNHSIRASTHGSGLRTGAKWDSSEGSIKLTGGYRIGLPLPNKYAFAGNYLAATVQISRVSGAAVVPEDLKLKASIWDNTDLRSLRGNKPVLTSTKIGHTGSETVTRQYILEVQMPDGRTFYSDVAVFAAGVNKVTNSISPTSINKTKFVTVEWTGISRATRYRLYRQTPAETDTNWYLVDTITNGTTQLNDYGGTGGGVWTIPSFTIDQNEYQYCHGFHTVGDLIQTEDKVVTVDIGLLVPDTFTLNGDQYLQLEFVKTDYSNSDLTDIASYGLRIDRIGLSYTNGRWVPSAKDLAITTPVVVNPPPAGGGSGGDPPSGGGGDNHHPPPFGEGDLGF